MYLRYLGTNTQFFNFEDIYGINRRTVSKIVTQVTEAMLSLEEEFIRFPSAENCLEVAKNSTMLQKCQGCGGKRIKYIQ